jgi:hypothetical protein
MCVGQGRRAHTGRRVLTLVLSVRTCLATTESFATWPTANAGATGVAGACVAGYSGAPTRSCGLDGVFSAISSPCTRTSSCTDTHRQGARGAQTCPRCQSCRARRSTRRRLPRGPRRSRARRRLAPVWLATLALPRAPASWMARGALLRRRARVRRSDTLGRDMQEN